MPKAPPPDLDLAFEAPAALFAAGALANPLAGAELWHRQFCDWFSQLGGELPGQLQAPAYCLGLSLVDDAAIAELNQDWRQKAGPTDVLAFAAQDPGQDEAGNALAAMPRPAWEELQEALELGDIVISVETAARQAVDHGHSLERELLFLASHGLLHLLGWDHPDGESLAAMLERQEQLLAGTS